MVVDFIRWNVGANGIEYTFYHNCPGGNCHLLDIGAEFDVVSSPLDFQPVKAWTKVRFQVVESIEQHGKYKGEWVRMYRPVAKRELTAQEVGAYWRMGEDTRLGIPA